MTTYCAEGRTARSMLSDETGWERACTDAIRGFTRRLIRASLARWHRPSRFSSRLEIVLGCRRSSRIAATREACSTGADRPRIRRPSAGVGYRRPGRRSRPMVWRWQRRYAEEGLEGLLRDRTRPPGIPPVPQAKVHAVVERTLRAPPGAVTRWTAPRPKRWACRCAPSNASGLLTGCSRIGIRTFKPSTDPDFAAKLVVGLYMNPPRHAVVVSIDERSQIRRSTVPSQACR